MTCHFDLRETMRISTLGSYIVKIHQYSCIDEKSFLEITGIISMLWMRKTDG